MATFGLENSNFGQAKVHDLVINKLQDLASDTQTQKLRDVREKFSMISLND